MKDWRKLFRFPKTYEDDAEGAVLATAILQSPILTVLSFVVTPMSVMAIAFLLFGSLEAAFALLIAGSLNLIEAGLLWNYGAKVWAARGILIGAVLLICAVISNLSW